jgi:WD40 repeat protein
MAVPVANSRVLVCSRDPLIKLWDLHNPSEAMCSFKGHDMSVTCVDYSPEPLVVSGSRDQTTRVWDVET